LPFVFCSYTGQRYSIGETTKTAMNVLPVIPLFSVFIHYRFVVVFPLNCIYRIVYSATRSVLIIDFLTFRFRFRVFMLSRHICKIHEMSFPLDVFLFPFVLSAHISIVDKLLKRDNVNFG